MILKEPKKQENEFLETRENLSGSGRAFTSWMIPEKIFSHTIRHLGYLAGINFLSMRASLSQGDHPG